ncbi:hypothetical protein IMZ08_17495 [Bacillus luteolus]|uniref:Uncharacterized protein n=1 Tax=Litchfieldia luteola TaxID=682179 RepID=A0ABR9QMU7_9BACI|nr:hypothetical protein [Cytobacillus luteolus]MBE4909832.1 hypothetical protein [Cytobacillus luteolus]MBP1942619.1 hypothetical protein [Cytobacillus luteolus]
MDYHRIEHDSKYHEGYKSQGTYHHSGGGSDDVVSVGTWIIILIILAIPIINIIVYLILAFGDYNENLKNFAKASLIIIVIGFFLAILVSACTY